MLKDNLRKSHAIRWYNPVAVEQLSLDKWPKGRGEVAFTLSRPLDQLAKDLRVQFEDGCDSLDDFKAAVIRLSGGGLDGKSHVLVFQCYPDSPTGHTNVILDEQSLRMLRVLVRVLHIRPDEIAWAQPEIKPMLHRSLSNGITRFRTKAVQRLVRTSPVTGFNRLRVIVGR